MTRLAGKVAVITGAASGIGRACARRFAAEGCSVVLADRDEPNGRAAQAELGEPHVFVTLDVTQEAAWAAIMAATVAKFGRLDILVNSAGIGIAGDIENTTLAHWRLVNAVNSDGVFLGCRAAFGPMKAAGGGSIINISSVAGLVGDPDLPAYCASKGAVRLLTKSVALHAARQGYNIRCNSVHPSFVQTPMVDAMIANAKDPDKARKQIERASPLGRIGEADDVASACVYLASEDSKFVTGSELVVDGGTTAR